MVKKEVKKSNESSKKKVDIKEKKFQFPKFLQDVEFNLYIMIYLLSIVVLLMSGVLFYTSELLKVTNAANDELVKETQKYDSYYDVRVISYTLEEFSVLTQKEVENIIHIREFAESQEFQEIVLDGFYIYAEKQQSCSFDKVRNKEVCKSTILEYDASNNNLITLTSGYK